MRQAISTEKGPPPQAPYSQAIIAEGPLVFVSGQGPVDSTTGDLRLGSFREQAELTFRNVATLLEAAGTSWEHAVKVGIYLADHAHFAQMNEVYEHFVREPYPARTTVQAGLGQIAIEVDCIAIVAQS